MLVNCNMQPVAIYLAIFILQICLCRIKQSSTFILDSCQGQRYSVSQGATESVQGLCLWHWILSLPGRAYPNKLFVQILAALEPNFWNHNISCKTD